MEPRLVVGTAEGACSASRFLLPFQLGAPAVFGAAPDPRRIHFRRCEAADAIFHDLAARKAYLTPETQQVLFGHASWWVLDGFERAGLKFSLPCPDGRTLLLRWQPPVLILMEDPGSKCTDPKCNDAASLLRCGFLVLEAAVLGALPASAAPDAGLEEARLEDLLLFNERFRYWREPFAGHRAKNAALLQAFENSLAALTGVPTQDMSGDYQRRWASLLAVPLADGRVLYQAGVAPTAVRFLAADDRAFVWTRALLSAEQLRALDQDAARQTASPAGATPEPGYWIKLLNIDGPGIDNGAYTPGVETNAASAFEQRWVAERTYYRWRHYRTWYGFTNFSGAMLAVPRHDPDTWRHWFDMYFDQTVLLLYLRVTLFRFSNRLTEISAAVRCKSHQHVDDNWAAQFRKLRWEFTLFENLYQYPLLSNQQQGLELYALARKCLDIRDLYDELASEIRNSDEFLEAIEAKRGNDLAERLNIGAGVVGSIGLTLTFIQTFSSVPADGASDVWFIQVLSVMLLVIVAAVAGAKAIRRARMRTQYFTGAFIGLVVLVGFATTVGKNSLARWACGLPQLSCEAKPASPSDSKPQAEREKP